MIDIETNEKSNSTESTSIIPSWKCTSTSKWEVFLYDVNLNTDDKLFPLLISSSFTARPTHFESY